MAAFRNNQNRGNETLAAAVTDVSDRVTKLIREEIELAKAETLAKVASLARGLVAVGVGAVFGVFALILGLITLGWALNSLIAGTGKIWIGFGIVFVVLLALTAGAFLFAWRKLKVGAPTPKMAIDEAKKITRHRAQRPREWRRPRAGCASAPGVLCGTGSSSGSGGRSGPARLRAGRRGLADQGRQLMAGRSPEEIRASIERNREELGSSLETLRHEVVRITDWRGQLRQHRNQVLVAAVIAGFVLGGGIAALGALASGGRDRANKR